MRVKARFDLNTLRVDGKIFEPGKKKLRIQKWPECLEFEEESLRSNRRG